MFLSYKCMLIDKKQA